MNLPNWSNSIAGEEGEKEVCFCGNQARDPHMFPRLLDGNEERNPNYSMSHGRVTWGNNIEL
jgi:hypothetical protein